LLVRKGGQDVAEKGKAERPGEQAPTKGMPPHVAWAVATAVVMALFAPGLFVAGFFTNELVNDHGGGTAVVVQPSPSAQPTSPTAPTPLPAVAVSVDDAPAWGPADAKVTVVEFGDYQ
jgi:protein-disulfide isomerase